MSVPNIFASDSGSIPLSQLDANFAYIVSGTTVMTGVKSITGSLAILNNAAATVNSDYLLNLNRLVVTPTDAKPYDLLAAGEFTLTGTAVKNGGGVLSVPTARVVYAGITCNFNGVDSETSALSGFNAVTDNTLTNPPLMWGGEVHVSKTTGVVDSQMIGFEIGVHKAPALSTQSCVGLLCNSNDFSSITASRAGEGVRIQGNRGWTYAIRYFDLNGSTELFSVSQTGLVHAAGGLKSDSLVGIGAAPNSVTALLVSGALMSGTSQYGARITPTASSAATSVAVGLLAGVATAAASFTCTGAASLYSQAPTQGAGSTITTAYGLFLETPSVGGTNLVIGSSSGATLTTAGAWTNAPSWRALKDVKRPLHYGDAQNWLEWVRDGYQGYVYRYHGRTGGPVDGTKAYDHVGFLLDDVPQDIREVLCDEESGGISTKDFDGFLLTVCQQLARDNKRLEERLAALEAKMA